LHTADEIKETFRDFSTQYEGGWIRKHIAYSIKWATQQGRLLY